MPSLWTPDVDHGTFDPTYQPSEIIDTDPFREHLPTIEYCIDAMRLLAEKFHGIQFVRTGISRTNQNISQDGAPIDPALLFMSELYNAPDGTHPVEFNILGLYIFTYPQRQGMVVFNTRVSDLETLFGIRVTELEHGRTQVELVPEEALRLRPRRGQRPREESARPFGSKLIIGNGPIPTIGYYPRIPHQIQDGEMDYPKFPQPLSPEAIKYARWVLGLLRMTQRDQTDYFDHNQWLATYLPLIRQLYESYGKPNGDCEYQTQKSNTDEQPVAIPTDKNKKLVHRLVQRLQRGRQRPV